LFGKNQEQFSKNRKNPSARAAPQRLETVHFFQKFRKIPMKMPFFRVSPAPPPAPRACREAPHARG
jgi:hypothetical protein